MTTNFTQFINAYFVAWTDTVTDPHLSSWFSEFDHEIRYNNQKRKVEEVALNNGASYTLSLSGLAQANWIGLIIKCIGQGYVTLTGQDASSSAITSKIPCYGISIFPGITMISTYNLTAAPTLTSLADGTVFEVYESTNVEDGQ